MHHAITVGDVIWPILVILGLLGIGGFLIFLIWLFNPFRTGH